MEDIDDIIGRFDDLELQNQDLSDHGKAPACCHVTPENNVHAVHGVEDDTGSESGGDMTCAICLCDIALENMAMVKGCDHLYCAFCILQWTLHKETPVCPTCKQPFSYLLTYRALDGSLNDFPMEESVVLLRRAQWFEDWIRSSQNDAWQALFEDAKVAEETAWMDEYDEDGYWKEDEEMEAFYFSSAAGKARIVLGNRRFGQGGFISGGHRQARPVKNAGPSGSGSKKKTKNKGMVKASIKEMRQEVSTAIKINTPNAQRSTKNVSDSFDDHSSPASSCVLGSSPSGFGRRAKRNARRHAEKLQQNPEVGSILSQTD